MSDLKDFVIKDGILEIYNGSGGDVVIPEGVTKIGEKAFSDCSSVASVVIPNSVTEILGDTWCWGGGAFADCNNLKSVVIPNSVTKIGEGVFKDCLSLTSVVIPKSVKEIGKGAFRCCKNLTNVSISENVKEIAEDTFAFCSNLESVDIPVGVTKIGKEAFSYCEKLSDIIIPDSVTEISAGAFYECKGLKDIVIPDGVTEIPSNIFRECISLKNVVIPQSVTRICNGAFIACKKLKSIIIPESVTEIGEGAFKNCQNLQSIIIPKNVIEVASNTFQGCTALKSVTFPEDLRMIGRYAFGRCSSNMTIERIPASLTDGSLKELLFSSGGAFHTVWDNLPNEQKAETIIAKQAKSFQMEYKEYYLKNLSLIDSHIGTILQVFPKNASIKECNNIASFMDLMREIASKESLQKLYDCLVKQKKATKALETIAANSILAGKLTLIENNAESKKKKEEKKLSPTEKKVLAYLLEEKITEKDLKEKFTCFYSSGVGVGSSVKYKEGGTVSPTVLMWLMTAHERLKGNEVTANRRKAGLSPKAAVILADLDAKSFQKWLRSLANSHLGMSGNSKKMYLAYPICRYADEDLMSDLTKTAPTWRSSASGNDAPPLRTFRLANRFSNTKASMLFADKYHELDDYARMRGTSADIIRDRLLSDVGIDENGEKTYDLGNQIVTAKLQSDLSFLIVLPSGKTAKSVPKKDADPALYEKAATDFSTMKKDAKKIVKNRKDRLFEDFLSGRSRKADEWKSSYLNNPLLRSVASLLVWSQGANTFTLKDGLPVCADGSEYKLNAIAIKVAHPMEMEKADVEAWQKYFTTNGLKQPFEQIWEPVVDFNSVKKDRYKGCMIPYYRFTNKRSIGIRVEDYEFHNNIEINIEGCNAHVERIVRRRHEIDMNDNFEITSFSFYEFTRQTNHIVAYFDRITIYGRVLQDDVTIADRLDSFTLAQITELLNLAIENKCTNCTALLLNYKETNFAAYDPMDVFTLD